MRCLYCGKELALFKRLRGGEFCSDAHRQRYQEEYTQLALNRLLQANSPQEKESAEAKPQEIKPSEPESPALKRRERLGREEAPAAHPPLSSPTAASASIAKPTESAVHLGALNQTLGALSPTTTPQRTAVLDHEPAPAAASIATFVETPPAEEPAPADMSSFLVELPVPALVEAAAIPAAAANLAPTPGPALPRLQEFPREAATDRLGPSGRIALTVCAPADFQTPPRERGLELREFVRGVPQVEIRVRPATETGFEPAREALEVHLVRCLPQDSPRLWQAFEAQLPALGWKAEIGLGELARLDFAATGWEEAGESGASVEQPPAESEIPAAIGSARLEPMRVDPIQLNAAPRESSRPEPLRFEPVHIDPVFMEQIAATAGFNALKNEAAVREKLAAEMVEAEAVEAEEAEAAAPEPPALVAPATSTPAASTPPTITKPVPVTLHGLAPARGKPVQVFTSAVFRTKDVHIPRETGLPLRPTMVLGPAPKLANAPASVPSNSSNDEKAAAGKPVKSIPVPEKRDPRPIEIKPRRSEVRILPVQVKQEIPQRQKEAAGKTEPAKLEQSRPEPVKLEPAGKSEPLTEPPAAASKEMALNAAPAEKPKPASAPAQIRPAVRVPAAAKPRMPLPEPLEEPDLLGLPKLSFQPSENFWTRLPFVVRIGAVAAVLALIVGGAILTSRGSGAPKAAPPANPEPQWVEAGSALATGAGWVQDWFADRAGSRQGRHVDVLRGSLTLRDYRLLFEGEIQQGALGWVFRANDKSFYVEKIQVITPGLQPVVALVHFAVIDGQEQPRTQVPLPIQAHLDTTYKVRMDAVGNRFTTWVQDQKVDQWTDSRIDAGGVGLYYDSGDSAKLRDTLNVIPLKQK